MEKFSELIKLEIKDLKDKISLLRKESLNLRFQKSSGQLEKTARIRVVKKQIARVKRASPAVVSWRLLTKGPLEIGFQWIGRTVVRKR